MSASRRWLIAVRESRVLTGCQVPALGFDGQPVDDLHAGVQPGQHPLGTFGGCHRPHRGGPLRQSHPVAGLGVEPVGVGPEQFDGSPVELVAFDPASQGVEHLLGRRQVNGECRSIVGAEHCLVDGQDAARRQDAKRLAALTLHCTLHEYRAFSDGPLVRTIDLLGFEPDADLARTPSPDGLDGNFTEGVAGGHANLHDGPG